MIPPNIHDLVRKGTPFTIKLRFRGWNPKRNCHSDCWWTLLFDPAIKRAAVACSWGKTGSHGNSENPKWYDVRTASDKLDEKRRSGYTVIDVSTPRPTPRPKTNPLAHLPPPFNQIHRFVPSPGRINTWAALDKDGAPLLQVPTETKDQISALLNSSS